MNKKQNISSHCGILQWFLIGRKSKEQSIDGIFRQNIVKHKYKFFNKRHLSADGFSLLPSALRPRLLRENSKKSPFRDKICIKLCQKPQFLVILAFLQIVAMSTIFSYLCSTSVSAASLTLSVPTSIAIDITPSTDGFFKKSETGVISAKTDSFFGYNLDIKAKTGNDLVNGEAKITSIDSSISEEDFKTTGKANTWGFLSSKVNGQENTNYLAGPTTSPIVIEKTAAANPENNDYNLAIAAKIDSTLAAGNYSNIFTVSVVANTTNYNFTYELNSGSGGPSGAQTDNTTESTVKLDATEPTKDNYEFLGWCDQPTSDETCSGHTYAAGAMYPYTGALSPSGNTVTFYAIWKQKGPINMGYLGEMQNFKCSTIETIESYGTVTDNRDSNTYNVAKLADDKCWMTSNLRLVGSRTLNSSDSDLVSSFSLPASTTYRAGSDTTILVYLEPTYGGIYTWKAATANSTISSNIAQYSICPKGWKLPSKDDYSTLISSYNSNQNGEMFELPLNFTLAGNYDSNPLYGVGENGNYWTSNSSSSSQFADVASFYRHSSRTGASTGMSASWGIGCNVRCVTRN